MYLLHKLNYELRGFAYYCPVISYYLSFYTTYDEQVFNLFTLIRKIAPSWTRKLIGNMPLDLSIQKQIEFRSTVPVKFGEI